MDKATPTRRRWLQFSLRGLLIAVTFVAALFAWLGWNLRLVQVRHDLLVKMRMPEPIAIFGVSDKIDAVDNSPFVLIRRGNPDLKVGPIRRLMGDREVPSIYFMASTPEAHELDDAMNVFPEASIYRANLP